MKSLGLGRYALCIGAAAALLAGCGGSQPQIGSPGVMPESQTAARAHVIAQRIRPASSSYQVLYSFSGQPDGAFPFASLIDLNGVLYGTTSKGGDLKLPGGTVFSVSTTGTEHVLYSWRKRQPFASLIDVGGTLYSTTKYGGYGVGTVFTISTSGKVRVLHSFGTNNDGEFPVARLLNVGGTLYGTTSEGGSNTCRIGSNQYFGCGTVFSITTAGTEKVLHSFGNGSDGEDPEAGLIDVNGTLYGTTTAGGAGSHCGSRGCASGLSFGCVNGCGTVFSVTKGGTEKVLHRFSFGSGDGALPRASLIDVSGTLYGTTIWGGPNEEAGGTVFSISTSGTEKILHNFGSGSDGANPAASLIDVNGTLYGTTVNGGTHELGTVFSITTSGEEKVLHSFAGGSDGAGPDAGLIAVNGTLYGTTVAGGGAHTECPYGCGTVFLLTTSAAR